MSYNNGYNSVNGAAAGSQSSQYPASYSYSGAPSPSYGSYGGGAAAFSPPGTSNGDYDAGLRRRNANPSNGNGRHSSSDDGNGKGGKKGRAAVVERLDFMFPKVDREFTVQTQGGGVATVVCYGLIALLVLAETHSWYRQNQMEITNTVVDTSLGKRMRVNLNITFPSLACDDLHLDAIDVAGDSQIDIEDTLKKRRLHQNGKVYSQEEIEVETNFHREQQAKKEQLLKEKLPDDYCGPCYGAHERPDQCCQTCDDIIQAYTKKRWKSELLKYTAEQCVREGRDKAEPKRMTKGQGCNLSGYMTVSRVSGNFHIAMGEGIERDGRHIHTYIPDDAPNFNASHVIHQLSFGPEDGKEPLSGTTKIVTERTGTTGLFQYFIKIVPTTYVGEDAFPKLMDGADSLPSLYVEAEESKGRSKTIETNRYFVTERFMPLMTDLLEDSHYEDDKRAAVHAGYSGGHHNQEHHQKQNSVLPGVFFIYEIYPFALEISRNTVPLTHLLIRIMATIGGVFTLARWADSMLYERNSHRRQSQLIGR
jgi:hypothetical protein